MHPFWMQYPHTIYQVALWKQAISFHCLACLLSAVWFIPCKSKFHIVTFEFILYVCRQYRQCIVRSNIFVSHVSSIYILLQWCNIPLEGIGTTALSQHKCNYTYRRTMQNKSMSNGLLHWRWPTVTKPICIFFFSFSTSISAICAR